MMVLGIEASAKVAGAALYRDGRIVAEQMVNGTLTHSETLMPMVEQVLESAGIRPEELAAIAVTIGPGSFTGLRIGAATAKGLALGLNIPIVPVSTLRALAANIAPTDHLIVPMMDARRGQVYGGIYAYQDGLLREHMAPEALAPQELAERLAVFGRPAILLGDGAMIYAEQIAEITGGKAKPAPAHLCHARAGTVAALGAWGLERNEQVPGSMLKLEYLRKPQAEREREERQ